LFLASFKQATKGGKPMRGEEDVEVNKKKQISVSYKYIFF
jgi:hypothetical protein